MEPATLRASRRLTVAEAAARLGTTTRTVYRLVVGGEINVERSGRRITFVHDDAAFRRLERRYAALRRIDVRYDGQGGAC